MASTINNARRRQRRVEEVRSLASGPLSRNVARRVLMASVISVSELEEMQFRLIVSKYVFEPYVPAKPWFVPGMLAHGINVL